jgi:hypothetical protein
MAFYIVLGEVSSTDLLCDTSSFSSLHIGLPKLIKDKCFSGIYMTKNTDDRASHLLLLVLIPFVSFLQSLHVLFFSLLHSFFLRHLAFFPVEKRGASILLIVSFLTFFAGSWSVGILLVLWDFCFLCFQHFDFIFVIGNNSSRNVLVFNFICNFVKVSIFPIVDSVVLGGLVFFDLGYNLFHFLLNRGLFFLLFLLLVFRSSFGFLLLLLFIFFIFTVFHNLTFLWLFFFILITFFNNTLCNEFSTLSILRLLLSELFLSHPFTFILKSLNMIFLLLLLGIFNSFDSGSLSFFSLSFDSCFLLCFCIDCVCLSLRLC